MAEQQQLRLLAERLPHKPYCSNDLGSGIHPRTRQHALRHAYIQHNPPPLIAWLVFDIDRPNSADNWLHALLPPPAWVAVNPSNTHCHTVYGVAAPVARTDAARSEPLRFAAAIEAAYREKLGADRGYSGLITKNPLHPHWRVWTPPSASSGIYDLHELAEYAELPKKLPKRDLGIGLGRNVTLFEGLRHWAYMAVRDYWRPGGAEAWHAAVLAHAESLNQFPEPLPSSEIRATAKSVAKWTWQRLSPRSFSEYVERTHTSEIQAERGRRSGASRRTASAEQRQLALELSAQGISQRAIAAEIGVTQQAVSKWLQGDN